MPGKRKRIKKKLRVYTTKVPHSIMSRLVHEVQTNNEALMAIFQIASPL